jgi:hypothetical protein
VNQKHTASASLNPGVRLPAMSAVATPLTTRAGTDMLTDIMRRQVTCVDARECLCVREGVCSLPGCELMVTAAAASAPSGTYTGCHGRSSDSLVGWGPRC